MPDAQLEPEQLKQVLAPSPTPSPLPSPGGDIAAMASGMGNAAFASALPTRVSPAAAPVVARPAAPPPTQPAGYASPLAGVERGLARVVADRREAQAERGAAVRPAQRSIAREGVQTLPEVVIEAPKSLGESSGRDADKAAREGAGKIGFDAEDKDNAVVKNAATRAKGTLEQLQQLSQDANTLKPLYLAWLRGVTSVNSMSASTGINPATPKDYAKDVEKMGKLLKDRAGANTTGRDMRATLGQGKALITSETLVSAQAKLNKTIMNVQIAKNELEQWRARLQAAAAKLDASKEKDKLDGIKATIEMISTAITSVAKVAAAASGAAAAASAAVSAAEIGSHAETLGGQDQITGPIGGGGPAGSVASGAGKVAESGATISKVLEHTVFAKDIAEVTAKIDAANKRLAEAQATDQQLAASNVTLKLSAADQDYKEAEANIKEAGHQFAEAMSGIGRTYDQRDMTSEETAEQGPEALPNKDSKFSMEAVLSIFAGLMARRSARDGVKTLFANNANLTRAQEIVDKALETSKGSVVEDEEGNKTLVSNVPIDWQPSIHDSAPAPSLETQVQADIVRRTAQSIRTIEQALKQFDGPQTAEEDGFKSMVTTGTGGMIK